MLFQYLDNIHDESKFSKRFIYLYLFLSLMGALEFSKKSEIPINLLKNIYMGVNHMVLKCGYKIPIITPPRYLNIFCLACGANWLFTRDSPNGQKLIYFLQGN